AMRAVVPDRWCRRASGAKPAFADLTVDDLAQDANALPDLMVAGKGEGEAQHVAAAAVDEAGPARQVLHPSFPCLNSHRRCVDAVGQRYPDEEAAVRPGPRGARREVLLQLFEHDVASALVDRLELLDVVIEMGGDPLGGYVRPEDIGAAVHLEHRHATDQP